ncbi:MAG: SDR family oxidoreductase [Rhodothermales bacterium]|nr:SDR family oxidoreductase [Rhodothermales bacterium]
MRLQHKTALVTGGGTGIGRAIAERFAREGARVAIVGRRADRLEETLHTIVAAGGQAVGIEGDVSVEADAARMVQETVDRWGGLDIVVNNAATILSRTALHETPVEAWDGMTAINVRGVFLVCRAALPVLMARGGGSIVNIASVAGHRGQPANSAYSATKGAILNLTRSLAVDYGPHGVRANSISPALVDTAMARTRLKPGEDWNERAAREWIPNYPLGRLGRPEDIASGALFLASDEAAWITGIDLAIDGGYLAKL